MLQHFARAKIFLSRDFSDGISKFIHNMGELSLDQPNIHKLASEIIIKPLINQGAMSLKFVKWIAPEVPKQEYDDDLNLDSSDAQFKLVARLIDEYLSNSKVSDKDLNGYLTETNMKDFIEKRKSKIEEADNLWEFIKSEHPEHHKTILFVLKGE
jgi:hypothetical protein